jgi:diguanylate cyclase (GGDEF)-like protein
LALLSLLVALLSWKIATEYRLDREAAASVIQISSRAMAAHVQETIEAVDQPLRISALGIAALAGKPMTPEAIQPLLAASALASDSRFWLLFIDTSGKGVVASNGLPVRGVSFADRSYFLDAAATRSDRLLVGGPADGRVSKRKLFFLSRRVESRTGKFLGVVAAPMDAARVATVFERARLGDSMSIALATSDNVIIARAPLFEQSFGADLSAPVAAAHPPGPQIPFETSSPLTGESRLFSYASVGAFPLIVVVGVTRESWTAHFRSDALAGALGLAIALAAAALSARFALAQFLRLEQVEASQSKLIERLGSSQRELSRGERRLRFIADSVPARVAYINADERYTFHNNGRERAPYGALMGKTILETHGSAFYELIKDDVRRALAGHRVSVERQHTLNSKDRHFKHQYDPDFSESGRVIGFYAMVTDITEFKAIQQQLSAIARVDSLTGLPNRIELLDRLEIALARCRRTGASLACLYLDIDRFKEVNDTLGHSGGDLALVEFGRRLRQCVRETDVVARLAGDEFVILLEGLSQPTEAERVAAKIIDCMAIPFNIEGARWPVTTSIGLVVADSMTDDSGSLLRSADDALYTAKRAGRNRASALGSFEGERDVD